MDPEPYTHVRATGTHAAPGVYRVVGADAERVVILQVADSEGDRVFSGNLTSVDRDAFDELGPAPNPDEDFAPLRSLRSALEGWVALVTNRL